MPANRVTILVAFFETGTDPTAVVFNNCDLTPKLRGRIKEARSQPWTAAALCDGLEGGRVIDWEIVYTYSNARVYVLQGYEG